VKPVFALEFHVSLWLRSIDSGYKSLAKTASPLVLGLAIRVLLGCRFPTHHSDLCLAESTMCPGPIETEPFESFLLFGIFVIVLALFFFLLGRLLFLRSCFYRWLLRNYFLDFLHFFGGLRFLNWLWRRRYFSGYFY